MAPPMYIPHGNIKQSTGALPDREGMSTHEPRNYVKAGAETKALTTETSVCSGCYSIAGKGYLVKKSHTIHSDTSSPNNLSQLQLCNKHGSATMLSRRPSKRPVNYGFLHRWRGDGGSAEWREIILLSGVGWVPIVRE
ncbi:Uncharacterized protein Fot_38165 [Forsythia ovata]|uniref:Uncharacterized protein n=1 Tax=Forsythia ovata TaxID=205694 RepID=A0ABD1S3C8_9LAMI